MDMGMVLLVVLFFLLGKRRYWMVVKSGYTTIHRTLGGLQRHWFGLDRQADNDGLTPRDD